MVVFGREASRRDASSRCCTLLGSLVVLVVVRCWVGGLYGLMCFSLCLVLPPAMMLFKDSYDFFQAISGFRGESCIVMNVIFKEQ